MRSTAYLSMGSNLGDRLAYLTEAASRLEASHTRLLQVSSVYETAPQGITDQPAFLNMALAVETELDPLALLEHIQAVERSLGRVRKERWGPRTIDIDILLYGDQTLQMPELELPHPRMQDRAFVLVPVIEIKPDQALSDKLAQLPDQGVTRFLGADSFLQRIRGVQ